MVDNEIVTVEQEKQINREAMAAQLTTEIIIDNIKKKMNGDNNYLIQPTRYQDEEFIEYKVRMKLGNIYLKRKSKGSILHVSKEDVSHIEKAIKKAGMNMPKLKGETYINKVPKTFNK